MVNKQVKELTAIDKLLFSNIVFKESVYGAFGDLIKEFPQVAKIIASNEEIKKELISLREEIKFLTEDGIAS